METYDMAKTIITCISSGFMIAFIGVYALSGAYAASPIEGIWASTDGESKIKISQCGANFCSKVVWLKISRKDANNENAALRDRDILGIQISNSLKPAGSNKWAGSVYSPEKGKTYKGFATVSGNNMTMKGCLTSAGILCQKVNFKRSQ